MGTPTESTQQNRKFGALQEFMVNKLRPQLSPTLTSGVVQKPIHVIANSKIQLTLLAVFLYFAVNHLDLFKHPTNSMISNIRMMIFVANLMVIYLAVLFLPEPSKKRGWSLFWKIIQGAAFAYAINILFWLFFSKENLQFVLQNIYDSSLGKPLGEKSYAEDCRVFTPENPTSYFSNIVGSLDMFVLAHFFGWTFKIWIFRNSAMAWFLSIAFEVMEWTMDVWLPNFKECWWDHLLFDMFGCNLVGMMIGQFTIRKFKMRKLFWFVERTDKYEAMNWYQKFFYSFTSRDEYIKNDKWHWLSELWTFNAVVWFWFMNLYMDLSYFYNKAMIEMPPPHWLLGIRMWILAFFSIIVANDYYDYVVTRKCTSMSMPVFLIHVIMILEGLLFLKNIKKDLFASPLHYHMKVFWIGFFTLTAAVQIFLFLDKRFKMKQILPAKPEPKKIK
jgi:phosphatidylserine synthase 2